MLCAVNLIAVPAHHNYAHSNEFSKFLDFSNNGGLIKPSSSYLNILPSLSYLNTFM